jgi:hypothetical protein
MALCPLGACSDSGTGLPTDRQKDAGLVPALPLGFWPLGQMLSKGVPLAAGHDPATRHARRP